MKEHQVTDSHDAEVSRLHVPRILDLATATDRAALMEAAASVPGLTDRIKQRLDQYLAWFRNPAWHRVYDGGLVAGPTPAKGHAGRASNLQSLLEVTDDLAALSGYTGFDKLISGLNNPTQVSATLFEISCGVHSRG